MANTSANRPLAAIYAQALYEAADGAGVLEKASGELAGVVEMLHKDARIETFLDAPTIPFADKRKVIEETFRSFTDIVRNFLLVLVERRRAPMAALIADEFTAYADRKANVALVNVESARALEQNEREKVKALLATKLNKTVKLNERVNPALIAGLVVSHDDTLWDGSLRHKLKQVLERMEATQTTPGKWTE